MYCSEQSVHLWFHLHNSKLIDILKLPAKIINRRPECDGDVSMTLDAKMGRRTRRKRWRQDDSVANRWGTHKPPPGEPIK